MMSFSIIWVMHVVKCFPVWLWEPLSCNVNKVCVRSKGMWCSMWNPMDLQEEHEHREMMWEGPWRQLLTQRNPCYSNPAVCLWYGSHVHTSGWWWDLAVLWPTLYAMGRSWNLPEKFCRASYVVLGRDYGENFVMPVPSTLHSAHSSKRFLTLVDSFKQIISHTSFTPESLSNTKVDSLPSSRLSSTREARYVLESCARKWRVGGGGVELGWLDPKMPKRMSAGKVGFSVIWNGA